MKRRRWKQTFISRIARNKMLPHDLTMVVCWKERAHAMERTFFVSSLEANFSGNRKAGETRSIVGLGRAGLPPS